jgi:molybdopterin molybdotransferase
MKEDVVLREDSLEVNTVVHPSKNVSRAGEDIGKGDLVLPQGHRLRPPDIALLGSLGLEGATVYERPKVAIIPTGGELVPVGIQGLKPGQAYEINRLLCRLYVGLWGGVPVLSGIVKDDPSLIKEVIGENCWADMILLLGGTSVGDRDYSPRVVDDLGELFFHGLRLAPGKPTALGLVKGKPVVCLPGYPVAALVALYLLVRPAIKRMAHLNEEPLRVKATLSRKISSRPGYVTVTRVAIKDGMAEPIMTSGAGILSSVTRSDGLVEVPEEVEGFEAGETVEVILIE